MKELSPVESRDESKINKERESLKKNLSDIFDNKEERLFSSINEFIEKTNVLEKNGLIFNKNEILIGLKESINIKDKETFITHLLKVLDPILISKISQPNIYKKVQKVTAETSREELRKELGHIFLSEFLYCEIEENVARIHLAAAYDYITKDKIEDFKIDIQNGFKKLAEIIKPMKDIDKIVISSWVIEKSPKRLKELGFTIEGEISKEEKEEHFKDDDRLIYKAYMDRKKFDELYLDK